MTVFHFAHFLSVVVRHRREMTNKCQLFLSYLQAAHANLILRLSVPALRTKQLGIIQKRLKKREVTLFDDVLAIVDFVLA